MTARIGPSRTTVTERTVNNASLILRLTSIPAIDANVIRDAIVELGEIFVRYNNWRDTLSLNLHLDGFHIFEDLESICTTQQTIQASTIHAFASRHFIPLKRHLINDLNHAPLQRAILDGDWVWEEDILNAAKALHPNSPFTRQPFAERPHDFANAVIRWLSTFNLAPNQNDVETDAAPIYLDAASLQIDESLSPQLADTMRRYQIATLEQRASLRINQRMSQANEERRRQLDQREAQLIPMMLDRIQAAVAHAQQHATVMKQSLRRQVNNYNQIRTQENQALQSRLDFSHQQVQSLNATRHHLEDRVHNCRASQR